MKVYRNIPFIDNKKMFFYQKINRRIWIEIPFIGFTFKVN
jgi:hypothetical protein